MEVSGDHPWFTEEDVKSYAAYLGTGEDGQRHFRTLLATVSEVLGETDLDALLRKLVEHAVLTTHSDRGILLLDEGEGLAVRVALDSKRADLGHDPQMAHSVAATVYREGKPIIRSVAGDQEILDLSKSAALLGLRQVMCAPLRARGRAIGAIYVDSTLRGPPRTETDLKLFHAQAGLMGMAVENHRLFQEAWNARDVQRQLEVARDIQRRLYPASPQTLLGCGLAGLNSISARVGGDYFDYWPLENDRFALGIGDVSGHGIAPALIMSDVRARLRSLLNVQESLGGVHATINAALCEELAEGMYVALFVAVCDPARGILEYWNAGHSPPLLIRAGAGRVEEIPATTPALGLFSGLTAGSCRLEVGKGDTLVCYTDGVIDRPDAEGEMYGPDRLKEVVQRAAVADASAADVVAAVQADSAAYAHGRPLRDDFTLLVARL